MTALLPFILYFVWSMTFPIGKGLVALSHPIFLTGFRMLVGGVILIGYLALRGKLPKIFSRRNLLSVLALSFFSIYITNILEFWSLKHLSAGKTCFIYSLSPFIASILSYIHFGEKMTTRKWIGMLIGFVGFLPVILTTTGTENLYSLMLGFTWPEIAMVLAALCSIYGWVILRIVVKDGEISPLYANGGSMLVGGTLALLTSFWVDPWTPTPIMPGAFGSVLALTLLMTFISNIFCYNLYGYLLKRYTATLLSFVGLLSPIFTSIHSWIILREAPSPIIIFSTLIVLSGLWLIYAEEIKQGYIVRKKKDSPEKEVPTQ